MENLSIRVTLMRDSSKIEINVRKIHTCKAIVLGPGSIISLTEQLEGCDFVLVDESVAEIHELIANKGVPAKSNNHVHGDLFGQRP